MVTKDTLPSNIDYSRTKGLLVRLFKRLVPNHINAKNIQFDFFMWCSFDGMKMKKVDDISEFYIDNRINSEDIFHGIYEEQNMCLYSTCGIDSTLLTDRLSVENINKGGIISLPLIALVEIKIYDQYINNASLKECENKIALSLDSDHGIKYQIFRSLGHSEFVILLRAASYRNVYSAIGYLKENNTEMILSIYSILGITINKNAWELWDDNDFEKVSIDLSLKTASSMQNIKDKIELQINKEDDYIIEGTDVLGKYDGNILITKNGEKKNTGANMRDIVLLYLGKNGALNLETTHYCNNINNTHTTWMYKNRQAVNGRKTLEEPEILNTNRRYLIFAKNLKEIYALIENKLPENFRIPLKELVHCYERLSWSDYTSSLVYDLEDILRIFFFLLIDSAGLITKNIIQLLNINQIESADLNSSFRKLNIQSTKLVISMISELINDRIQANRSLFESPVYNIKFNGSIAKIFSAYAAVINTVEDETRICLSKQNLQRQSTGEKIVPSYYFLTMDLSNTVVSHLFFYEDIEYNPLFKLISINCDSTSFFQPEDAVCSIMHEMSHYMDVTDNNKKEQCLLSIICKSIAQIVLMKLLMLKDISPVSDGRIALSYFQPVFVSIARALKKILNRYSGKNRINVLERCVSKEFPRFFYELMIKAVNELKTTECITIKALHRLCCYLVKKQDIDRRYFEMYIKYAGIMGVNEPSEDNRNAFTQKFFEVFELRSTAEEITESLYMLRVIFNELYADTHMLTLLDLSGKDYLKFVNKWFERSGINFKNETDEAYTITLRKIMALAFVINGNSGSETGEGMPYPCEEYEKYKEKVHIAFKSTLDESLIQFIRELRDIWSKNILKYCPELSTLCKLYRKMCLGTRGKNIGRQIEFIEHYWMVYYNRRIRKHGRMQ